MASRSRRRGAVDLRDQRCVCLDTPRRLPLRPRIITAGGDTQQPANGGDRESGLILAHEPEPFDGIVFVSRANQAAAFIPLEPKLAVLTPEPVELLAFRRGRPLPRRPASHPDWPTQFLIDCAVGSNSCASDPVSVPIVPWWRFDPPSPAAATD
jgi:hypothetical protein